MRDGGDRVLTDDELNIQADAGSNVPEIGNGNPTSNANYMKPPKKKKKGKGVQQKIRTKQFNDLNSSQKQGLAVELNKNPNQGK